MAWKEKITNYKFCWDYILQWMVDTGISSIWDYPNQCQKTICNGMHSNVPSIFSGQLIGIKDFLYN